MRTLLTTGYEGAVIDDFIATLKLARVDVLIDVREIPLSRKRGFSKTALGEALGQAGVDYVHLRDPGDPKPGREAARRGDQAAFEHICHAHLSSEPAQAALAVALESAENRTACLLCFERNNRQCHRTIVADAMAVRSGTTVRHIGVKQGVASTREGIDHEGNLSFAFG